MVHIDRKDGIFFSLLWVAMHGCWDITQELSQTVRQYFVHKDITNET